ncbi:hypothetical protein JMJ55_17705 [Belnapia sp. T6]|uniref:Uncharacterized protein n=1 Tax=Belnapia mucosa TaxID=2804532 RepID=A0ABS1V682_9PROT|nr:hypothetical protein [Belnapia mucosa]MBL6457175.1 hypothetical protein [Belnapia mucosa]
MPLVTLVMANGPGYPQGSADHRYEMVATLTPGGHLDPDAWLTDPNPWPATRVTRGAPPRQGDVQWDEHTGWSLRFFPADGDAADAPLHALIRHAGQLRPGEYVTIQEPNGVDFAYRVVGLG